MKVVINKFHIYGFLSHRSRMIGKSTSNSASHFFDALFGLQKYYDEHPGQYELDRDCWWDDDDDDCCEE